MKRAASTIFLFAMLMACAKSSSQAPVANDGGAASAVDLVSIARAEDQRRASDIGEPAITSHDVVVRRRAARALARIADEASEAGLLRALSDEDPEVAAWGAYGLGFSCRDKASAHVAALSARAASIPDAPAAGSGLDVRTAIARALGKCGGTTAEKMLTAWVRGHDAWSEPATYGLGDIGNHRGTLDDETVTALLDAAGPAANGQPVASALYPFSRIPHTADAFAPRVLEALRGTLAKPSPARIFSVRALARIGPAAAGDLSRIAADPSFTNAERGEAVRGLGQLGLPGKQGAADALAKITASGDLGAKVFSDEFVLIDTLVVDLGTDPPSEATKPLQRLAALTTSDPSHAKIVRVTTITCDAAAELANKAFEADVLTRCAPPGSEARDRAMLRALVRRPLVENRRRAWIGFSNSDDVRIREDALESIADHAELGEAARAALAAALSSKKPGVVTTAADLIKQHPDRVLVISAKAIAATLDPSSPPPKVGSAPARSVDPEISRAISDAIAEPWAADLIETRIALIDAAVAIDLKGAREAAQRACQDPNVTLRDAGKKALAALGEPYAACNAPDQPQPAAPEVDQPLTSPKKLTFASDAGTLVIHLDPTWSPIAATRMVSLAQSGFFHGIVVHRVVPGFVAQFGDPEGDGFGGSGKLLRCETSPVPFDPLDVGIALAGRDTGSSQLFVTLSRTPHLDGEYTHLGHAEGDWGALVEGDLIGDVTVMDDSPSPAKNPH